MNNYLPYPITLILSLDNEYYIYEINKESDNNELMKLNLKKLFYSKYSKNTNLLLSVICMDNYILSNYIINIKDKSIIIEKPFFSIVYNLEINQSLLYNYYIIELYQSVLYTK